MFASASTAMNLLASYSSSIVSLPTNKLHTQKPFSLYRPQSSPLLWSPQHLPTAGSRRTTTSVRTAVAAVDSSDPVEKQQTSNKYYFVVANAKFMLDDEEHFQEQLCERLRLFEERNMEQDFWLVIEPKFLDQFPNITKRLKRPAVALVSTNGTWIRFMKLRLDRVLSECFEAESLEEALAYNPVKLEFEQPSNWVAPYPKYESEWWGPFLPPISQKQKV